MGSSKNTYPIKYTIKYNSRKSIMTDFIAFIIIGSIFAGYLYHTNEQNKKEELRKILQQYMVLDNHISPEEQIAL